MIRRRKALRRSGFKRNGIGTPVSREQLHRDGPPGYGPCTRSWPHDGPCAHPEESYGTIKRYRSMPVRRAVSPASSLQRAKAREGCRVHGLACGGADPAHVCDRSIGGCDHEDCTVPLCRPLHTAYDDHRFDLLPHLSLAEQSHAVAHLGLLRALKRITGSEWTPTGTRY